MEFVRFRTPGQSRWPLFDVVTAASPPTADSLITLVAPGGIDAMPSFSVGEVLTITGGVIPGLPGITLGDATGLATASQLLATADRGGFTPFSGVAEVAGFIEVLLVPEPSGIALVSILVTVGFLRHRWRRCSRSDVARESP